MVHRHCGHMTDTSTYSGKNILIVDDEPLLRLELAEVVEACGHHAVEAANAADALAMLDRDSALFEALITDICRPGTRNGTVLASHVRCLWPEIKIVVISGARRPLTGTLPEQVEFLSKPIPRPRLVAAIHSITHP